MIKASNPVLKDGLGILARLVVIAMLLSILSALLQGCTEGVSDSTVLNAELVNSQAQVLASLGEVEKY